MGICNLNERTDHEGNIFNSKTDMCNHWNIKLNVYNNRIRIGWSIEDALTKPIEKINIDNRTDHEGTVFGSQRKMCEHWGMDSVVFRSRIERGWSKEKALTTSIKNSVFDHEGNEFKTIKEMCEYWGIPYNNYIYRIERGWSKEKVLTTSIKNSVFDHEGNEFKTIIEMCEYWEIDTAVYRQRIERDGWSKEKALTTPYRTYGGIDHNGNEFKTIKEMCEYWGIPYKSYIYRIELGWSKEKALTTSIKNSVFDHEGNEFKTIKEMCEYWGINYKIYYTRINKYKWSKEKALTHINKLLFTDPIYGGIVTTDQLSKRYNIPKCRFLKKYTNIYSLPQLLNISIMIHPSINKLKKPIVKYDLTLIKRTEKGRNVFECYIDNKNGTSTPRIMSQEMIDEYCIQKYKEEHGIQ